MPPKVKFTKDEIIQAALNVARVKGASSVSTRDIAAELQVSTRPIFTYFDTMEEVRAEIRKAAEVVYERYVQRGLAEPIPFLGVGMEYIRFAREEPQLYRLLFLTPAADETAAWAQLCGNRWHCCARRCRRFIIWMKLRLSATLLICCWWRTAWRR